MKAVPLPIGVRLLIVFFVLATAICLATVATLAAPGTPLDAMWRMKPQARADFLRMGVPAVFLMALVASVMAVAAVGLWKRSRLGWWAAVAALSVNAASDGLHALLTSETRDVIGIPIAGLLVGYLCQPRIRALFSRDGIPTAS